MSMSTHVVGFRPRDVTWERHENVWTACVKAGVPIPKETIAFFDGVNPAQSPGREVPLTSEVVHPYASDGREGYDVIVANIPKDIAVLRFYNAW